MKPTKKKPRAKRKPTPKPAIMEPEILATVEPPAIVRLINPPPSIGGEALAEWDRVCGELAAAGGIQVADRAIIVTYCQAWAVNRAAAEHVARYGAIIKWPNGLPGPSPFYKAWRETTSLLRGLLADLGLTPATRKPADAPKDDEALDLD